MFSEKKNVPGYQRVLIVDEHPDPENPGKMIAKHTEVKAHEYVQVMTGRMAVTQQIVESERTSLANHNLNLQSQVATKDAEIARLLAEIAALKGETINSPANETDSENATEDEAELPTEELKKPDSKDLDLTNAQAANLSKEINDLNKKGKGGK